MVNIAIFFSLHYLNLINAIKNNGLQFWHDICNESIYVFKERALNLVRRECAWRIVFWINWRVGMGIFSRFTDIINSNINALLDGAEDPAKMIRLIIQEMEETLVEVRSSCVRIIADKKEAQRRLARLQNEALEWERKAKLAISKERDDLARAAIAEKAALIEDISATEAELVTLNEHLDQLNDEVAQLQVKLDDAKAQQKELMLRAKTAESRYKVKKQLRRSATDDAFTKFELFQRRIDELEGRVESFDVGRKDLADEIDQLAKDDDINNELDRLKEELKQK